MKRQVEEVKIFGSFMVVCMRVYADPEFRLAPAFQNSVSLSRVMEAMIELAAVQSFAKYDVFGGTLHLAFGGGIRRDRT